MASRYISLSTAADILDCSPRTVRRRIAEGHLTGYRVGNTMIRLDPAEVEALLRPIPSAEPRPTPADVAEWVASTRPEAA